MEKMWNLPHGFTRRMGPFTRRTGPGLAVACVQSLLADKTEHTTNRAKTSPRYKEHAA
jgi:hypothetical protein